MHQEIRLSFPVNQKHSLILIIHENKLYIGQPKSEDGLPTAALSSSTLLGLDSLYEVNQDHRYSFIYKSITGDATAVNSGLVYFAEVLDSDGVKHVICALKPDDYESGDVKLLPAFVIHDEDDRLHQLCAHIYDNFRRKKHKNALDTLSTIASKWSQESYFDLNLQQDQVPEEILFGLAVNRFRVQTADLGEAIEEVKSWYLHTLYVKLGYRYTLDNKSSDNQEVSYADVYAWCYSQAVMNSLFVQQMEGMALDNAMLSAGYDQLTWMNCWAQEDIRRLERENQEIAADRNKYCTALLKIYEASGLLLEPITMYEAQQYTRYPTVEADIHDNLNDGNEVTAFLAITDCAPGQESDVGLIDVVGDRGDRERESDELDLPEPLLEDSATSSPVHDGLASEVAPISSPVHDGLASEVAPISSPVHQELATENSMISTAEHDELTVAATATDRIEQTMLEVPEVPSTSSSADVTVVSKNDDELQTPATSVSSITPKLKARGKRKNTRREKPSSDYSSDEDFSRTSPSDTNVARRMVASSGFSRRSQAVVYHAKCIKILNGLKVNNLFETKTAILNKLRICEDSNLVEIDLESPFLYIQALRSISATFFAGDRVPSDKELGVFKELFQLLIPKNCTITDCKPEDCATPVEMVNFFLHTLIGDDSSQLESSQNYDLRKGAALRICKDVVEIIVAHGFSYSYVEGTCESEPIIGQTNRELTLPHVMHEFMTVIEPIIYDLMAGRKINQLVDDFMPLFFDKTPTGSTLYKHFEILLWNAYLNADIRGAEIVAATIRKMNKIFYAYLDLLQTVPDEDQKKMCDALGNILWVPDVAQTVFGHIVKAYTSNPVLTTLQNASSVWEFILSLRLSPSEQGYRSHPAWKTNPILRRRLNTDDMSGALFMNLSVQGGERALALQLIALLSQLERQQLTIKPNTEFRFTYICLYGAAIHLSLTLERETDPDKVYNLIRVIFDLIMTLSIYPHYGPDYNVKFRERLQKFYEYLTEYCPNQSGILIPLMESMVTEFEKDPRVLAMVEFMQNQVKAQPSGNASELLFSGPKNMSTVEPAQLPDTNEAARDIATLKMR